MLSPRHKSALPFLKRIPIGLTALIVLGLSAAPATAQTLAAKINNALLSADQCMTPWVDGTKVCRSRRVNGFSLLTFNHPDQKRWVIQYENVGLRVNDGGTVRVTKGYKADILLNGAEIATYDIAYQSMGQEWSHIEGARKRIRTPADLEARGDIPKHTVPQRYWLGSGLTDAPAPKLGALEPYKPLHNGPLIAWMPAQGWHQEVHWTSGLARWAIWPEDPRIVSASAELIKVSAESFAGFPIFLTHKGAHHPIDLRAPYYENVAFDDKRWARNGNQVEFRNGAPVQPGETERGMFADAGHLACPGWEQFLLDGDPYHLRALHFCGTWGIGWTGNELRKQGSRNGKAALVPNRDQPRSWAKVLMLLWRAHEYTPEGNWEWLLPKSYWAQSLKDSERQALVYLAKFPNARVGRIQIDYAGFNNPKTAPFEGVGHLGHADAQSLWAAGWMVAKGYEGFRPLYDILAQAHSDALNAVGASLVNLVQTIQNAKTPNGKRLVFQTWDEAGVWLIENAPWPVGPDKPGYSHVWAEERFEGAYTSLVQLGFDEMRPLAEMMRNSRLTLSKCANQKRTNQPQDDICPTWSAAANDISPDWSFALEGEQSGVHVQTAKKAEAETVTAPPSSPALQTPQTSQPAKPPQRSTKPKIASATTPKPSKPAPQATAPAQTAPAVPKDNLPLAGATTLPDPGLVTLPDPGKITLP